MPSDKSFKPGQTAAILRRFGLRLTKTRGQHFLVDDNIRKKIIKAAVLSPADNVLEIGAGIGTLTVALAQKCKQVLAVEIDKKLLPVLAEITSFFENVKILPIDAMKLSAGDLKVNGGLPNKTVSNLPYNIAAPLLITYLENFAFITDYTVMVQKEIAARILAGPGDKDYGAFTLKLQFLAETKMAFGVPRSVFLPPPRVDSAVIRMRRRLADKTVTKPSLFRLIEAAFSQRRKKLVNAVSEALVIDKQLVADALVEIGISPGTRAESLTLADFIRLESSLNKKPGL